MKIIEINKDQTNRYEASLVRSQFLQSFEWGEFQGGSGIEVLRFGLEDEGRIVFAISLYVKSLPFNKKYFYSPRIDLSTLSDTQYVFLLDEIKKISKAKNAIFWRIEPTEESKVKSNKSIVNSQLPIVKTLDVQASKTNILAIEKDETEILKNMHQKTRYNIRLAERKGVVVRTGTVDDFEKFWSLMNETKERDGFRLHGKAYYVKMLKLESVELILAEYEGKIIAGNIVSYFGDMASYLHGSSSDENRNVMAPYLIQWQTILRAKAKGCRFYDFNGIDDNKWPGVTRFKRGFGGEDVVYPGALDIVFLSYAYYSYVALRFFRRLLGKISGV